MLLDLRDPKGFNDYVNISLLFHQLSLYDVDIEVQTQTELNSLVKH